MSEWQIKRATLYRRLKKAGLDPAGDITTQDLLKILIGDREREEMALLIAKRRLAESEAGAAEGDLVSASKIGKAFLHGMIEVRQIIETSHVSDEHYALFLEAVQRTARAMEEAGNDEK